MSKTLDKVTTRLRRVHRIRKYLTGTSVCPRLSVFRSLKGIFAQIINDQKGQTLVAFSDLKIKKGNKTERAKQVGEKIAELAKSAKIKKVIFDRRGFRYCGRIQALADAARKQGLNF